jgi:transcriptional antiterminator RfaH
MHQGEQAELPWFVVHTQPRRENVAETTLAGVCLETFCPRYRKRTIIRGYRRTVSLPLFPGYLFARFEPGRFRAVHYAQGVCGVVRAGDEPATVPAEMVEAVAARLVGGYVRLTPGFVPGHRVAIAAGPLAGFEGVFEEWRSDHERVAILLDRLGYSARVIVDRDLVQAVP